MPRPTRIEYEGAYHHVMNRGRARQTVFHDQQDFEAFLLTLKESSERFDARIHAYCLMTNHYHLLIETPRANLSRIMQHINGLYTQRYNRRHGKDGTLFRGRYKSVLVDEDAYLLQLSRYIHRNPIETRQPMVKELADYPWSSYPAYINRTPASDWLVREKTYQMLGQKQRFKGYQTYVAQGNDEDILRYYNKGNIFSVLGSLEFRESVKQEAKSIDVDLLREAPWERPAVEQVIDAIGQICSMSPQEIKRRSRGQKRAAAERRLAMYACQYYSGAQHKVIAEAFNLSHVGSASHSINQAKREIALGQWAKQIKRLEEIFNIVK